MKNKQYLIVELGDEGEDITTYDNVIAFVGQQIGLGERSGTVPGGLNWSVEVGGTS